MKDAVIRPLGGQTRATPVRPAPHRTNPVRAGFGVAAVMTFALGFALAPGWWFFSAVFAVLGVMSGHFKRDFSPSDHDEWLATAPDSLDLRARFRWGDL